MRGNDIAIMPTDHLTKVHTLLLELQDRLEQVGQFILDPLRRNPDGGISLSPAEVTQLRMLLGA